MREGTLDALRPHCCVSEAGLVRAAGIALVDTRGRARGCDERSLFRQTTQHHDGAQDDSTEDGASEGAASRGLGKLLRRRRGVGRFMVRGNLDAGCNDVSLAGEIADGEEHIALRIAERGGRATTRNRRVRCRLCAGAGELGHARLSKRPACQSSKRQSTGQRHRRDCASCATRARNRAPSPGRIAQVAQRRRLRKCLASHIPPQETPSKALHPRVAVLRHAACLH